MRKIKSKKMFDITIDDIKFSVFNKNEDRLDYIVNKSTYPYGWGDVNDTFSVKEDDSFFVFTLDKDGRFSLLKKENTIDESERGIFITADVIDFHAPSDIIYKDRIKVSKLYKDPKIVGNLCYLKKKELVAQNMIDDNESIVKIRSYNGPILVQGQRFFMCNGSTWIITYKVNKSGEYEIMSRSPESLHIYGWGDVIGVEEVK